MPMYKLAFLCFLLCSLFSNAQNDLKTNTFKMAKFKENQLYNSVINNNKICGGMMVKFVECTL